MIVQKHMQLHVCKLHNRSGNELGRSTYPQQVTETLNWEFKTEYQCQHIIVYESNKTHVHISVSLSLLQSH